VPVFENRAPWRAPVPHHEICGAGGRQGRLADGVVYVGSEDGYLYAIEGEPGPGQTVDLEDQRAPGRAAW
jgi:hypothetical protein